MIAIRWLGAFRKQGTFEESLVWELEVNRREVAAEPFALRHRGCYFPVDPGVEHCSVGLLVAKGAIVKTFYGDVWSVPSPGGEWLVPTMPACSTDSHREAFCKPKYRAIIVRKPLDQLRPAIRRPLVAMARKHSLPIKRLQVWEAPDEYGVERTFSRFINISLKN